MTNRPNTLPFQPRPPRHRRRRRGSPPAAAAPPLVLASASYDGDAPGVHLTFERAIDLSGLVPAAFTVIVGPESLHLIGSGSPTPEGENGVLIFLADIGVESGPDTLLTAGEGNGIVAVDDGGMWAGITDLVLPFP